MPGAWLRIWTIAAGGLPSPVMAIAKPAGSSPTIIRAGDLRKTYGGHAVLDGVTLEVGRGSFVALVGASGAGKTTLLKTINRLLEPDSGDLEVDGEDTSTMPLTQLRRQIGYVFQGVGLFPHMTIAQNILIQLRLQGKAAIDGEARVSELLDLVSLPQHLADRFPSQLSGGQAQRVGFARALAARPKIMLMDEPFGALDPVTRSDLGKAYRQLHDRMGLTSLLVTHDLAEALLLSDRILVLSQGRILADASPAELLHLEGDPQLEAMIDTVRAQAEALDRLGRGGA